MDIKTLEKEYLAFLEDNSDPQRAKKEKAYLYLDLKFYGILTADRRNFFRKYKNFLSNLSKSDALKAVEYFWDKPEYDMKCLSLHILNMYVRKLDASDIPLIEKLMRESKGWALLDNLVIPIMPIILEKDPEVYSYLDKWIRDYDFWVRRSALLAQLIFFRQDNGGDRELFFKYAKSQFDEGWIDERYTDTEERKRARFFIRKAIGWTLREMSHKQPEIVFDFLRENKDMMSGLSLREGGRKLPAEMQVKLFNN